jgi:hypothetical protein
LLLRIAERHSGLFRRCDVHSKEHRLFRLYRTFLPFLRHPHFD